MGIRKGLNGWNKAAWCRMTLWSRSERTFVKVLLLGIKLKKKIHHLWCYWSVGDLKLQNALDNDIFYQPKPTQTKYDIYIGCTYTESCVAKGNRVVQHFCIRAAGGTHKEKKNPMSGILGKVLGFARWLLLLHQDWKWTSVCYSLVAAVEKNDLDSLLMPHP